MSDHRPTSLIGARWRSRHAIGLMTRASALACAALLLAGTGSLVSAKKPAPPAGPPLTVAPFQVYRPESTGGYAAEEYGQTSIWWRFTTQRDGGGRFTFTFPQAPAGARGFEPLQLWDPAVLPVDAANVVAMASQQSWCRPKITELVSGEGIDQVVAVKYPNTCTAGNTLILQWRGPLYWNGFSDTNGPDAQPNPNDRWSFPVRMWAGKQPTSTATDIEVIHFPAMPVGLEPLEFVDPITSHPDASVPMLMIDLPATPVYLEQPALSAYVPESLVAAGRDSSGTPIQTSITIIGTSVIDVSGSLVPNVDPYLIDPNAPLIRQVITPIVVDGGCTALNVGCLPDADGYVTLPGSTFIDQSGDPIPEGYTITLSFSLLTSALSNQLGANLLCNGYGGTFDVNGLAGLWICSKFQTRESAAAFAAEILMFRPEMGSYYCPSRNVRIYYDMITYALSLTTLELVGPSVFCFPVGT